MNLLFIGAVVGQPGRRAISDQLPTLRNRPRLDLVVANAENIANGAGITRKTANELFAAGVDVLSNGNHAWDKKEALEYITTEPRLLRPHNYPDGTPGTGWFVATTAAGYKVGILNLMGNVFMHPHLACPFAAPDRAPALWRRLVEDGRPHGLLPAGLGARDTLRLEARMMLYGNDMDESCRNGCA